MTQFFCGYNTHQLKIAGQVFKMGGAKRNVKCQCRNGQNGDPSWKKSCGWEFKGQPFSVSDVQDVECKFKFTTTTTSTTPVPNTRPVCRDTYSVETQWDCAGNDIRRGIPLEGGDHRDCEELCRENNDCVGWTWHGRTSNWSECWIKNKMANCKPKASGTCNKGSCITGTLIDDGSCQGPTLDNLYTIETNFDCTGGDFETIQVGGATDAICQELCEDRGDQCVGYVWSSLTSTESWCHLKKNIVNCHPIPAGQCGGELFPGAGNGSWKRTCYTGFKNALTTPPNTCDGKFDVMTHTDCGGNDITKFVLGGDDHRECAAKCAMTDGCVGYTWHGRTSDWSECWVKHAVKNCRPLAPGACSKGTCISAVLSNKCTENLIGKIFS